MQNRAEQYYQKSTLYALCNVVSRTSAIENNRHAKGTALFLLIHSQTISDPYLI